MNKLKSLSILFILVLTTNVFSQNINEIDSLFQEIHDEGSFNGNVLISKKGEVIFKKSYGFSVEGKKPLTDSSIFNLASITKQFTAAGIVLLARENKIEYDDDIRAYLPELSFYPKITIRNLLHHTSGLYDYMELTDSLLIQTDPKTALNNQKVMALFEKNKP